MARDGRSDTRETRDERQAPADRSTARTDAGRSFEVPTGGLRLPRTDRREPIALRERVYHLRESEARALAGASSTRRWCAL